MNVNGYLEIDGDIVKISTIDELKDFVTRLGNEFKELTEQDYRKLCAQTTDEDCEKDDCGVKYSNGGKRLIFSDIHSEEYKVAPKCTVVADGAFSLYSFWYNEQVKKSTYLQEKAVKKISMPNSVIALGAETFYCNGSLVQAVLSNSLRFIGSNAFAGCGGLTNIEFPLSLRYLGSQAFLNCKKIENVLLPEGLKSLGSHAFKGCTSLRSIYLPSTLEIVGSGIIDNCDALEEIRIPSGTKEKFSKMLPFSVDKLVEVEVMNG